MRTVIICLFVFCHSSHCKALSVPLTNEERRTALNMAGMLYQFTRPTFNERLGLALPGFYLKQTIQYLEIMFMLDSSRNVGASNFETTKGTTKVLVDYINNKSPISQRGSKVCVMKFSSSKEAKVEFGFGDYNSVSTINSAIDRIQYDKASATTRGSAMHQTKTQFKPNGPTLSNITNVLWLVIGGTNETFLLPTRHLKEDLKVKICVVLVGSSASTSDITSITSPGCLFQAESYSSYQRMIRFAYFMRGGKHADGYAPDISPTFFN